MNTALRERIVGIADLIVKHEEARRRREAEADEELRAQAAALLDALRALAGEVAPAGEVALAADAPESKPAAGPASPAEAPPNVRGPALLTDAEFELATALPVGETLSLADIAALPALAGRAKTTIRTQLYMLQRHLVVEHGAANAYRRRPDVEFRRKRG